MEKKYKAFTLLEMLIVMSIIIILGGISISSFDGLRNTIQMNEYIHGLEQDIRAVQRASMLLERNPMENWLYGLGIDFSQMDEDGEYVAFKWCSIHPDYGHITTTSKVPAFDPDPLGQGMESTKLPFDLDGDYPIGICGTGMDPAQGSELKLLPGYEKTVSMPKANVMYNSSVRYVLFESVSGRAFFYNQAGNLLNYEINDDVLTIMSAGDIEHLSIKITPWSRRGASRELTIKHLSGRVDTKIL